jgi:hypothetical protein
MILFYKILKLTKMKKSVKNISLLVLLLATWLVVSSWNNLSPNYGAGSFSPMVHISAEGDNNSTSFTVVFASLGNQTHADTYEYYKNGVWFHTTYKDADDENHWVDGYNAQGVIGITGDAFKVVVNNYYEATVTVP